MAKRTVTKFVVICGYVARGGQQVFVGSNEIIKGYGVDPTRCAIIMDGTTTAEQVSTLYPGATVLRPSAKGIYGKPPEPFRKAPVEAPKEKAKAAPAKAPAAAKKPEPKAAPKKLVAKTAHRAAA
jgi:hypothetical protein